HWEWFVWVHANPPQNADPATYLRKAPAFFPDAFLEDRETGLRGGVTQPLWGSVAVPRDAAPGDYRGTLTVTLAFRRGSTERVVVPVALHVWPFSLPDRSSLHHTEWFHPHALARWYHLEPWSEKHWMWIERCARDLAAHKADMINTDLVGLTAPRLDARGRLTFDFSRFDRWIDTFRRAGIEWIEGGHVAGRTGGWVSPIGWNRWSPKDAQGRPVDTSRARMSDAQFKGYTEQLLKAVHAHLKARGLAHRYVQHVADEPTPANLASWKSVARDVGRWLPGVRRIDAIEAEGMEGACELRVPQIQEIHRPSRLRAPEELWCYVCLSPQTIYPNRFLDYPSIRNRMIYWLCWSLNLKGFLHWAYNYWQPWSGLPHDVPISPWTDTTGGSLYNVDTQPLPAGDAHVVYPGKDSICSSIRWEVIRKGYEDFELLRRLEAAVRRPTRRAAASVARGRALLEFVRGTVAPDPARHTHDDRVLLAARREAGALVSALAPER
ncbi:MAG: glycoside hydrolase domain-containing protein, partial [bacterium]